jgi:guanylate kinase
VLADLPGLEFSVSHTTRQPRQGEVDGVQYHFVNESEFMAIRDQEPSGFLEWAEVHGYWYGTSVAEVAKRCRQGKDVLLDIDVQGAAQVCGRTHPVTVFIAPPSMSVLESRLRGRGADNEQTIVRRLHNAHKEMAAADAYQYLIVNDRLDDAVEALRSIIIAERSRQRRDRSGAPLNWQR